MNERNFHIFYRMLAPGRAVENHEDSEGGEKTEEVVTKLMTTADSAEFGPAECLLFDEVLLTTWFSGSYQSSHRVFFLLISVFCHEPTSRCSPTSTKPVVASAREGRE